LNSIPPSTHFVIRIPNKKDSILLLQTSFLIVKTSDLEIVKGKWRVIPMRPFMNYKIIESEDGIEVVLYLDQNLSEFSDYLGTISKTNETNIKQDAVSFVKKMFPTLKVKSIKVMAGAMLLTSIGLASLPSFQASAAEPISSYTVSAGDTLYNIAQRNGTTVDAIKQANQLTSNVIHIGDTRGKCIDTDSNYNIPGSFE